MIRVLSLADISPWLFFLFGTVELLWVEPYPAAHEGVIGVTVSTMVGSADKEILQMCLSH